MSKEDLEQYRSKMIAAAFRILKDKDQAEDVAQEAMLSALKWLRKEPILKLEAWLVATVTNGANAVLRTQKRHERILKARVLPDESQDQIDRVATVLDAIDPFQKQIIVYRYLSGGSDAFIAGFCHVSRSRARGIMAEARHAFRAKWVELFGDK